jgi:hypothetical protein
MTEEEASGFRAGNKNSWLDNFVDRLEFGRSLLPEKALVERTRIRQYDNGIRCRHGPKVLKELTVGTRRQVLNHIDQHHHVNRLHDSRADCCKLRQHVTREEFDVRLTDGLLRVPDVALTKVASKHVPAFRLSCDSFGHDADPAAEFKDVTLGIYVLKDPLSGFSNSGVITDPITQHARLQKRIVELAARLSCIALRAGLFRRDWVSHLATNAPT